MPTFAAPFAACGGFCLSGRAARRALARRYRDGAIRARSHEADNVVQAAE